MICPNGERREQQYPCFKACYGVCVRANPENCRCNSDMQEPNPVCPVHGDRATYPTDCK